MKLHEKYHHLLGDVGYAVAQYQKNPAQVC